MVPRTMEMKVLIPASTRLFQTMKASPSLNNTVIIGELNAFGHQTGG